MTNVMKVLVGIIVAGAIFFLGAKWMAAEKALREAKAEVKTSDAKPKHDESEALARAKKRIHELESELAAAKVAQKALKEESGKAVAAADPDADATEVATAETVLPGGNAAISVSVGGGSNEDLMKQLRKQIPKEHFAEVTNTFAKMRERHLNKAHGKVQYLASIDTSEMTDEQRKKHQRYLELLAKQEELSRKNTGILPDMSTLQEQVELQTELTPLAKEERKLLVDQLSKNLGYEGNDAVVIHETVQDIVDATSPSGVLGTAIATSVEELGLDAAPGGAIAVPATPGGN